MKNKLIIGLICLLASCSEIDTRNEALTIHSINQYENGLCSYLVSDSKKPYKINFAIIDSCNKYNIGDTIK